jgi:hypothetical protein
MEELSMFSEDLLCPLYVCAVTRRRFPVGASPTRQPLQPEATGGNKMAEAFGIAGHI